VNLIKITTHRGCMYHSHEWSVNLVHRGVYVLAGWASCSSDIWSNIREPGSLMHLFPSPTPISSFLPTQFTFHKDLTLLGYIASHPPTPQHNAPLAENLLCTIPSPPPHLQFLIVRSASVCGRGSTKLGIEAGVRGACCPARSGGGIGRNASSDRKWWVRRCFG
jgi:hypothetical protein